MQNERSRRSIMTVVKQRVASMESSLKTLNRQEDKYAAELDAALAQYAELRQWATNMDTTELDTARQSIRHKKEQAAAQSLQATHGKRFNSQMLARSRKDVAGLRGEAVEPLSIHQVLPAVKFAT